MRGSGVRPTDQTCGRPGRGGVARVLALCVAWGLAGNALLGCTSQREMLRVQVWTPSVVARADNFGVNPIGVAVAPFEDRRPDTSRLGTAVSLLRGRIPVKELCGSLGEQAALAITDYLQRRSGWQAWIDKPGVSLPQGDPPLRISGQILDWVVEARSWLVATRITARIMLSIEARDGTDDAPVRMVIQEREGRWTIPADQPAIEDVMTSTLHKVLDRMLAALTSGGSEAAGP